MSNLKKTVLEGEILMKNGENLFVRTLQDRTVQFKAESSEDAWEWYCKPVRVTIEEIPAKEMKRIAKKFYQNEQ